VIPKKGTINVIANGSNSAYVDVREGDITLKGIAITGSCHFTFENGKVVSYYDDSRQHSFKARRTNSFDDAPPGVTKELHELMRVAAGVAWEKYPKLFAMAGLGNANNAIMRLDSDIAAKEAELRTLMQERAAAISVENDAIRRVAALEDTVDDNSPKGP